MLGVGVAGANVYKERPHNDASQQRSYAWCAPAQDSPHAVLMQRIRADTQCRETSPHTPGGSCQSTTSARSACFLRLILNARLERTAADIKNPFSDFLGQHHALCKNIRTCSTGDTRGHCDRSEEIFLPFFPLLFFIFF